MIVVRAGVVLLMFVQVAIAQHGTSPTHAPRRMASESLPSRTLDVNRIKVVLNNRGSLNNDNFNVGAYISQESGTWDPSFRGIVYDQGPWIIGKLGEQPASAMTIWGSSFAPGPMINGKPALWVRPADASRYRPYRLTTGQNPHDSDYVAWPADLGAPVNDDGTPRILGNQSVWEIFNGADSAYFPFGFRQPPFLHLPVEVQQTVFARGGEFADTSLLANAVFFEWTIINKGPIPIDSCYLGLWADIDFGENLSNVPGVDTVTQTAFCWWNSTTTTDLDQFAVGHVLLYGPKVPDASGEAVFRGKKRAGYRNLPMSSSWGITEGYLNDTLYVQYPYNIDMAWNFARGLDRNGHPIRNPRTGEQTRFPYSGDPATGKGWFFDYPYFRGVEAGYMFFSGPFTFAPADTQWMMVALLPVDKNDYRESILTLRERATRLRSLSYDSLTKASPFTPYQPYIPARTSLFQNYPNPFNGTTTIVYEISEYTSVRLVVYDLLGREVRTVVRGEQEPGQYSLRISADGLASGVYFARLSAGAATIIKKMLVLR
jgi:hypothetical protein